VRKQGAVVIWPASEITGAPPPGITTRFPELVPDVARVFERPVAGRLPALRYGWAVIRPKGDGIQKSEEGKNERQ
jgi:hypothetical protein